MATDELICIATFSSEMEAELARIKLAQASIASCILKDDCGGMYPYLQAFTGVRLMVNACTADAAKQALSTSDD